MERHCGNDATCQRCGAENETINHIIFECPPAVQCWALSAVPSAPGYFPCSSIYVNFDILLQVLKDANRPVSVSLIPWLIWSLWKARNEKCFNNKDSTPLETLQLAGLESEAWFLAQVTTELDPNHDISDEGEEEEAIGSDETGRWKCQVDASWTEQDNGAGLGFIFFDGPMEIIQGQSKRNNTKSSLHVEAESLIWAMEELRDRGFRQVIFETDCQQLVNILRSSQPWPALEPEIDAIMFLTACFTSFNVRFISRSLNFRADSLAKEARSRDLNFVDVAVTGSETLTLEASMIGQG